MFEDSQGNTSKARLREQINENLKRVYEDALKEEIPDRFKVLLQQLKAKESNS
jgi:hypothetical protein